MGAVASDATEEQIICSYNEKQHEECKKSVATYEQMIADYNTLIDKAEKDQEALDFKIAELENELNHSNTISKESEEKIKDLEKKLKELAAADKTITDLKNKLSNAESNYNNAQKKATEMESKYRTTDTNYNNAQKKATEMESKYKIAQNNYDILNERIKRLRTACPYKSFLCDTSKVYDILQEKFTPIDSSYGTIIYCIIALVVGILIGTWLFGNNNRSASMGSVGGNIFNPRSINKNSNSVAI